MSTRATARLRTSPLQSANAVIDPYPIYRSLRQQCPVRWDAALGSWIVLGYDSAIAALRDPRLSVERSSVKPSTKSGSARRQLDPYTAEFMMLRDAPPHT